ncbi:MAG: MBL fold metallo-hydrolase [Deltaproteobacteria bacterium]|nr:MBL fold metallo-hydrolase [Deltaproteobacteria bacterium]
MNASETQQDAGGLSSESTGGEDARRGFRYQDLWLLARVSELLEDNRFHAFRNEGADDAEIWFRDEDDTSSFIIHRYQLKDTTVGKPLLIELFRRFYHAHTRYAGQWASFNVVSSRCSRELEGVARVVRRLHQDKMAYGEESAYYLDTHAEAKKRFAALGVETDIAFLRDYVTLELNHSEANSFERTVKYAGVLLSDQGVPKHQRGSACDTLLSLISHKDGEVVERSVIFDRLNLLEVPVETPSVSESVECVGPVVTTDPPRVALEHVNRANAFCRVQIVPGGAVVVELPGERYGIIDCGHHAARAVLSYLQFRSVSELEFVAVSHWHADHYFGFSRIISAYSDRIKHAMIPDVSLLLPKKGDLSRSPARAVEVVTAFERMAKSGSALLHVTSGGTRRFEFAEFGHDMESVALTSIAPRYSTRYLRDERMINQNEYCTVFSLDVGPRRFLVTGDAELKAWTQIFEYTADGDLKSDALILPHHGSGNAMTGEILSSLVKSDGFIAIVEPNRRFRLPHEKTLDAVRALGGRIVVCENEPVSLTIEPDGIHVA